MRHAEVDCPTTPTINIQQSLGDMIFDVVHLVMSQKSITKTTTTQQLGICRTTLRKYLKRDIRACPPQQNAGTIAEQPQVVRLHNFGGTSGELF